MNKGKLLVQELFKVKPFKISDKRLFGDKVIGADLKSREFEYIEKVFPQSDEEIKFIEGFYGKHRPFIGAVTSLLGTYLILKNLYDWYLSSSLLHVSIILSLFSYIIITGLGLYVSKDNLDKIDEGIALMLKVFIERTKYLFKRNICISDKSANQIKWNLIILPLIFVLFMVKDVLSFTQDVYLLRLIGADVLWQYVFNFKDVIVSSISEAGYYSVIMVTPLFTTLSSPLWLEKSTLKDGRFRKLMNYCTFSNIGMIVVVIISVLIPVFYYSESVSFYKAYNIYLTSNGILFRVVILLLTLVTVLSTYLSQKRTMENWQGNSNPISHLILRFILLPYYFLFFLPFYCIPVVFMYVSAWIIYQLFELSMKFEKLPSPTKQAAFLGGVIALSIRIWLSY